MEGKIGVFRYIITRHRKTLCGALRGRRCLVLGGAEGRDSRGLEGAEGNDSPGVEVNDVPIEILHLDALVTKTEDEAVDVVRAPGVRPEGDVFLQELR